MAPRDEPEVHDEHGRLDRELDELLQELRVLLPGTTVLLGFLLALAFGGSFADNGGAERSLFTVAFLATAAAVVLLIAPGVRHRGRFRERDKEALISSANRITLGASLLLAISLASVVALVMERLYGWGEAIAVGGTLFAMELWFWWGWAASRAAQHPSSGDRREPGGDHF